MADSVRVFAQVSGLLTKQFVDIGDRVQRGQALAVLEVPEIEAALKHARAVLDQARARVMESKAKFSAASADLEAARAAVAQAEASVKSAEATVQLHASQHQRMKVLFESKAVEARVLAESKGKHDAALEAERVARAQVSTSKAQVVAAQARTDQARADLAVREAGIAVAAASLEKLSVAKSFANLAAPFDGVVTQRGYVVGDFIRSADNRGNDPPVFTIQRTDVLRVQVAIAEREAPLLKIGDAAELEIDAFPNRKWASKVARVAGAVDRKTGTMMVEIDLPNPEGQILPGMTARVTINPERR
jgi:multidrug efflux pump subunit AcrA (membrane-fusion protein)